MLLTLPRPPCLGSRLALLAASSIIWFKLPDRLWLCCLSWALRSGEEEVEGLNGESCLRSGAEVEDLKEDCHDRGLTELFDPDGFRPWPIRLCSCGEGTSSSLLDASSKVEEFASCGLGACIETRRCGLLSDVLCEFSLITGLGLFTVAGLSGLLVFRLLFDSVFVTVTAFGVPSRATIELLVFMGGPVGGWRGSVVGIGGVADRGVSIGLCFSLDFKLTAVAFPRMIFWAATGLMTALLRYAVVATLFRIMLGVILDRAYEVRSSAV